jgi:hypothetical protein
MRIHQIGREAALIEIHAIRMRKPVPNCWRLRVWLTLLIGLCLANSAYQIEQLFLSQSIRAPLGCTFWLIRLCRCVMMAGPVAHFMMLPRSQLDARDAQRCHSDDSVMAFRRVTMSRSSTASG